MNEKDAQIRNLERECFHLSKIHIKILISFYCSQLYIRLGIQLNSKLTSIQRSRLDHSKTGEHY